MAKKSNTVAKAAAKAAKAKAAEREQTRLAVRIFNDAQSREELEGDVEEAVNMYDYIGQCVKSGEQIELELESDEEEEADDGEDVPPLALVGSSALNSIGGHLLDLERISDARQTFEDAVEMFPRNSMAQLNLANLEREHGDVSRALSLYQSIAACTTLSSAAGTAMEDGEQAGDREKGSALEFWLYGPRERCVAYAAYACALLLHQLGRPAEAVPHLQVRETPSERPPSPSQADSPPRDPPSAGETH